MIQIPDCLFCKIVSGAAQHWSVWEDAEYLAFLTPFPNTPGFTVVIPKTHQPGDFLQLDDLGFQGLLAASREVARLLKGALDLQRVGLVIEGMGIDHAHVKLIPMHGIPEGPWKPILSTTSSFTERYQGSLTTNDGPRMEDEALDEIQSKIRSMNRK